MAVIQGGSTQVVAEVDPYSKALRVCPVPRAPGHILSGVTGIMAAALAANSMIFYMRHDPSSPLKVHVDTIRLHWTTITAFTAAVAAGRRLGLYRATGIPTPGANGVQVNPVMKSTVDPPSEVHTVNGGDCRIATTGAIPTTGLTFENDPLALMSLTHVGAAGAWYERVYELGQSEAAPIILQPGQVLAIRNPVVMDAGGTWQLLVEIEWNEPA